MQQGNNRVFWLHPLLTHVPLYQRGVIYRSTNFVNDLEEYACYMFKMCLFITEKTQVMVNAISRQKKLTVIPLHFDDINLLSLYKLHQYVAIFVS